MKDEFKKKKDKERGEHNSGFADLNVYGTRAYNVNK